MCRFGRSFRMGKKPSGTSSKCISVFVFFKNDHCCLLFSAVELLHVLSFFEDTPTAPLSIHALAIAGARGDSKKKVGDWVIVVLRFLCFFCFSEYSLCSWVLRLCRLLFVQSSTQVDRSI
jgi:hypothetical protein